MLKSYNQYQEENKIDFEVTGGDLVLLRRLEHHKQYNLDFDVYLPTYGRNLQREYVWNITQQRALIESVFLERKIPPIAVMSVMNDKDEPDTLQVIDGKQRLITLIRFYENMFDVEIDGEYYFYSDLTEDWQQQIKLLKIQGYIAYDWHDDKRTDEDKLNWFKLINFAGTPQDKNHLDKFKIKQK